MAIVIALTITLGLVTYLRFGGDAGSTAGASDTSTTTSVTDTSSATIAGTTPTTTAPATSSTTTPTPSTEAPEEAATTTTTFTTIAPAGEPPAPPADIELVEIGPNSARIEWTSEECVGSRYQVGDFAEGGGGYPNVDRCWTDHVVLAGDPNFSPVLAPDTEYVVRIHAVGRDGQVSEPRFITIRTTSG